MSSGQARIRARCVHPTGRLVEFPRAEIEGTMPDRFAREAARHPDRLAIATHGDELTYRAVHPAMTAVAQRLRERLVQLDAMPLNATSKVDRAALPRLERSRPDLETPFDAPLTPIEEMLSRIWMDVLGLDRVGIHDGFLELGGDSLLAARVVSRVLDAFDVDVPVRALLESPTVAAMAMVVIARRIEVEMAKPAADPGPTAGLA